jgi:hypothetical protein
MLNVVLPRGIMLNAAILRAECRFQECRSAESHGATLPPVFGTPYTLK